MALSETEQNIENLTSFDILSLALKNYQNSTLEKPQPGTPSFEYDVLCYCFLALNETIREPEAFCHDVIKKLRTYIVHRVSKSQLMIASSEIASILIQYLDMDKDRITQKAAIISQISIQITSACFSRLQKKLAYEQLMYYFEELSNVWNLSEWLNNSNLMESSKFMNSKSDIIPILKEHSPYLSCIDNIYKFYLSGTSDWPSRILKLLNKTIESALWPDHFRTLACFWQARSLYEMHQKGLAIETLESFLATEHQSALLCLLLARFYLDNNDPGRSVSLIDNCSNELPETLLFADESDFIHQNIPLRHNLWEAVVTAEKARVGEFALKKAMHSPQIDESLLELAMHTGTPKTFSEAALCWYDAGLDGQILAEYLYNHDIGRKHWILRLASRENDPDKLYQLYLKLRSYPTMACMPDILLLEVLTQLDNPEVALISLEQNLPKLKKDDDLFWKGIDLWGAFQISRQCFHEAIQPFVDELIELSPKALNAFRHLIVMTPREAVRVLQTALVELTGIDKTREIFNRIKEPLEESKPVSISIPSIEEMALWMLPLSDQILCRNYHVDQLNERRHEELREQIMSARGLVPKKTNPPPEPSSWIHHHQPKASDAFDN